MARGCLLGRICEISTEDPFQVPHRDSWALRRRFRPLDRGGRVIRPTCDRVGLSPLEPPAVRTESEREREKRRRRLVRPELQSSEQVFRKYSEGIRKVFGKYPKVPSRYQESICKVFGKCPLSIRKVFIKYSASVLYVSGKDL